MSGKVKHHVSLGSHFGNFTIGVTEEGMWFYEDDTPDFHQAKSFEDAKEAVLSRIKQLGDELKEAETLFSALTIQHFQ